MKFEYLPFVKKEKIEAIFDNGRRYLLTIHLSENPKKTILIISKNPSKADKNESDNTVNSITKYVHNYLEEFDRIMLANLFVCCSPKPRELNPIIDDKGKEYVMGIDLMSKYNNNNEIKKASEQASKIIVAWGNSNGIKISVYNERKNQICNLLSGKELICADLTKQKNPLHSSQWLRKKIIKINTQYCKNHN